MIEINPQRMLGKQSDRNRRRETPTTLSRLGADPQCVTTATGGPISWRRLGNASDGPGRRWVGGPEALHLSRLGKGSPLVFSSLLSSSFLSSSPPLPHPHPPGFRQRILDGNGWDDPQTGPFILKRPSCSAGPSWSPSGPSSSATVNLRRCAGEIDPLETVSASSSRP